MRLTRKQLSIALCLALSPMAAQATTEWTRHATPDGAHPTGYEQEMLFLLNRARANPVQEAAWLAYTSDPQIAVDRAGFAVNQSKAQQDIAAFAIKPPLAFDARLYSAARLHNLNLIRRAVSAGYFDRTGAHDGQEDLMDEYFDFTFGSSAGNVHPTGKAPVNAHAAFVIDWSNNPGESAHGMFINPGHRITKLSGTSEYSSVGIAAEAESVSSTSLGPWLVTENYRYNFDFPSYEQYQDFIVGTVYEDLDGNGRYSAGEGVAGVTVSPDIGDFHAVTGAAGGYAIPITARGATTVTFSGGGISTRTRNRVLPAATSNPDSLLLNLAVTGTGPMTASNNAVDAFLLKDTLDPGQYGPAHGGLNQTLVVEFENVDTDYSFAAAGFDVDTATEIEVVLNGARIGFLRSGAENALAKLTRFSITKQMQQPGVNTLEFRNTEDSYWGVSRMKLRSEFADSVSLNRDRSNQTRIAYFRDPALLGYRYGTSVNKSVVRATFEAPGDTDFRIKADAFHNNRADKVAVFVNNQFVQYMNKGKAKRLHPTTIDVNASLLNAGVNTVEFRQMLNLGRKWGITNIRVFERP